MRSSVVVEADPVTNHAGSVLDAVEAMAVNALLFQRADHALYHAVLLRAVRGYELLLQPITPDQCREVPRGKNQAVVRTQEELVVHPAKSAEAADQNVFQCTGGCRGLACA